MKLPGNLLPKARATGIQLTVQIRKLFTCLSSCFSSLNVFTWTHKQRSAKPLRLSVLVRRTNKAEDWGGPDTALKTHLHTTAS